MDLKVLSWNIWFDGNFKKTTEFISTFDADIIGLQEVVSDEASRDIIGYMTGLGYHHVFGPVATMKDGRTFGNAIFSKFEIIKSEVVNLSESETRNAVRADIKIGTETLHVFSTHLLHTHQKPSDVQNLQAENLLKALPSDKTVVMGDFNATPESEPVRMMRERLVDADPASAPTWSIYPEGCMVCKPQSVDMRLDYIFVSKDLHIHSSAVGESGASDHLPVSVILSF